MVKSGHSRLAEKLILDLLDEIFVRRKLKLQVLNQVEMTMMLMGKPDKQIVFKFSE